MQEEVENRTVNLAISTTKLTFRTIVNGYNAWKRHHQAKVAQKTAQLPVGKQSIKELIGQKEKPSVLEQLNKLKELVAAILPDKVRHKSQERDL